MIGEESGAGPLLPGGESRRPEGEALLPRGEALLPRGEALLLKGAAVAQAVQARAAEMVGRLKAEGLTPAMAIIRVGERPEDLSYEKGAMKKCESVGLRCLTYALPESIDPIRFQEEFTAVNADPGVHGILLFRPLPKSLDEDWVRHAIDPRKDLDCMGPANQAKLFCGDSSGFAPCTAEAVMESLRHYGIGLAGKRVAVVGRSMVIGKPLSMMLLQENATVTICHSKTRDLAELCAQADIVVAALGKPRFIGADFLGEGTVAIDVGINLDGEGKLCGDIDFAEALAKASAISPVPGGIGSVTSSILALHAARAAEALSLPKP